jgi:acylphosphatase
MLKRIELKVYGRVQGVNFRSFAKKHAEKLCICGYASNEIDGTVEVLAEGEEKALEQFIDFLKKGPTFAKVEKVEHAPSVKDHQVSGFLILSSRKKK